MGLVSLELLLRHRRKWWTQVRERAAGLGLKEVLVVATHTHSSFGGYDARWWRSCPGTGRFGARRWTRPWRPPRARR